LLSHLPLYLKELVLFDVGGHFAKDAKNAERRDIDDFVLHVGGYELVSLPLKPLQNRLTCFAVVLQKLHEVPSLSS